MYDNNIAEIYEGKVLEGAIIEIRDNFKSLDYNIYENVKGVIIYNYGLVEITVSYTKDEEDIEAVIITNINNILISQKQTL